MTKFEVSAVNDAFVMVWGRGEHAGKIRMLADGARRLACHWSDADLNGKGFVCYNRHSTSKVERRRAVQLNEASRGKFEVSLPDEAAGHLQCPGCHTAQRAGRFIASTSGSLLSYFCEQVGFWLPF